MSSELLFELTEMLIVFYLLEVLDELASHLVVVVPYLLVVGLARADLLKFVEAVDGATQLDPLLRAVVLKQVNVTAMTKCL